MGMLGLLACIALARLAHAEFRPRVVQLYPTRVPTNAAPHRIQVLVSPAAAAAASLLFALTLPNGTTVRLSSSPSLALNGIVAISVPRSESAGPAWLSVVSSNSTAPTLLIYYSVPTFSGLVVRDAYITGSGPEGSANLTTAGLLPVALVLSQLSAPFDVARPRVLATCAAFGGNAGDSVHVHNTLLPSGDIVAATPPEEIQYYAEGSVDALGEALTFLSTPVPALSCTSMALFVSYNDCIFHFTGLSVNVTSVLPVTVYSAYPAALQDSPWVRAHNLARIQLGSRYQYAVDATAYAVNTSLHISLPRNSVQLLICAGAQYRRACADLASANPDMNVLIVSSFHSGAADIPNLSTATGRMYEALFLLGYAGAAVSASGRLGIMVTHNVTDCYAFINAFYLGAQASVADGHSSQSISVHGWIMNTFNDPWAEQQAAIDLIANNGVDVLLPMTDGDISHSECHARGCHSLGFSEDKRLTLGDNVLMSAVYQLAPVYLEFARRVVTRAPFGPEAYSGGLSRGVEVTGASPHVSQHIQQHVAALATTMRSLPDEVEKVFCTTSRLDDASGGPLFDASLPGSHTRMGGLDHVTPIPCMPLATVQSMMSVLEGVTLHGTYVAPPHPDPFDSDDHPHPPPTTYRITDSVLGACLVVSAVLLLTVIGTSVIIWWWRQADAIRYASPFFLLVINLGAGGMGLHLLLVGLLRVSTPVCKVSQWWEGLCFALLFGSLFAKTYRIHRLFNNHNFRRLRITHTYVLKLIGVVVAAEVGVQLVLTFVFPYGAVQYTRPSLSGDVTFTTCGPLASPLDSGNIDAVVLMNALHLLLLGWGAYLAFRTRDVPLGFNESRYIAICIYNVIFWFVAAITLSRASTEPSMQYFTFIIRIGVAPLFTVVILHTPKLYSVGVGLADAYLGKDGWYHVRGRTGDSRETASADGSAPKPAPARSAREELTSPAPPARAAHIGSTAGGVVLRVPLEVGVDSHNGSSVYLQGGGGTFAKYASGHDGAGQSYNGALRNSQSTDPTVTNITVGPLPAVSQLAGNTTSASGQLLDRTLEVGSNLRIGVPSSRPTPGSWGTEHDLDESAPTPAWRVWRPKRTSQTCLEEGGVPPPLRLPLRLPSSEPVGGELGSIRLAVPGQATSATATPSTSPMAHSSRASRREGMTASELLAPAMPRATAEAREAVWARSDSVKGNRAAGEATASKNTCSAGNSGGKSDRRASQTAVTSRRSSTMAPSLTTDRINEKLAVALGHCPFPRNLTDAGAGAVVGDASASAISSPSIVVVEGHTSASATNSPDIVVVDEGEGGSYSNGAESCQRGEGDTMSSIYTALRIL